MASAYKRGDKWYARYKDWKQVDGQWVSEWKPLSARTTNATLRRQPAS